jgi:dihydrofolate synthase/folylpolyglutamate synthase
MRTIATYQQAIEFLYGRLNFEQLHSARYSTRDFKLDRMRRLLQLLGDPQNQIPVVHIAGTKGKGSTAAMIAGILSAAGYRTGLFTSPHITCVEERMQVDGVQPTPARFAELVNRLIEPIAQLDAEDDQLSPTFFEIVTALGWLHFLDSEIDIVALEVGLGGRLDSTNICRPEVCVITNISRDHMTLLGNTLDLIAAEKAGIVKPGVPVVSGVESPEALAVIESVCQREAAPLLQLRRDFDVDIRELTPNGSRIDVRMSGGTTTDVPVGMSGEHQAINAALATTAVGLLAERGFPVEASAIRSGLKTVRCPLRVEQLASGPTVIVDAAHNVASVTALVETLAIYPARRRILVFGTTQDKEYTGMLARLLPAFDAVVLTNYQRNPRFVPVSDLRAETQPLTSRPLHTAPDPAVAWKTAKALATADDLICITGSFFLAAEMRELIATETDSALKPPTLAGHV